MEKNDLMNFWTVVDFYDNLSVLKEKERTGWIKWNVTGRRESVNDHTTSAQYLAWALYCQYDIDVNIEHVIALLSIHEPGESKIGDITAYDGVDPTLKAKREREAVVSLCSGLRKGNILISLFDEFEAKETPEAKFAYFCDKLDFDLQARLYCNENRCSIEKATYEMISIKEIQELIENGAKTAWEIFWQADKLKFDGTYLESFFAILKNT